MTYEFATKFAHVPTIPMDLDGLPDPVAAPAPSRLRPRQTTLRRVHCPRGEHSAGIVQENGHLVWREHQIKTMEGPGWRCPASGERLCELPYKPTGPKDVTIPPQCRHNGSEVHR